MLNKKLISAIATGLLVFGMAASAFAAAPSKFSVQADELDYDMKTGEALAKGHVVIIQDNAKATGDNAQYNSKTKSGSLKGNVVADRGDERITCDEFKFLNDNDYSAIGNAVVVKEGKKLAAPQINYYKAREFAETIGNWARLTDVDGSTVDAVKLIYDARLGLATATGGVNINSPARKLTAYADKAIYNTKQDGFIELIGNAKATQDGNTIQGDKLRLTNSNNVAVADGNVRIVYIPEQKPVQSKQEVNKEVITEPALAAKETEAKA